jgi:hypothetical protein
VSNRGKNEWLKRQAEMAEASSRANAAPEPECAVCSHADCAAIEEKMRAGVQLGVIVESWRVLDHGSVRRHRDEHLKFGRVTMTEPEPAADPWDDLAAEMAAALRQT